MEAHNHTPRSRECAPHSQDRYAPPLRHRSTVANACAPPLRYPCLRGVTPAPSHPFRPPLARCGSTGPAMAHPTAPMCATGPAPPPQPSGGKHTRHSPGHQRLPPAPRERPLRLTVQRARSPSRDHALTLRLRSRTRAGPRHQSGTRTRPALSPPATMLVPARLGLHAHRRPGARARSLRVGGSVSGFAEVSRLALARIASTLPPVPAPNISKAPPRAVMNSAVTCAS